MQCPFCGAPMEIGYIKSARTVHWIPLSNRRAIITHRHLVEASIPLAKRSWGRRARITAHCCRDCRRMVVDYVDDDDEDVFEV